MLLCPQHNRYLAERDYGPGVMRDAVTRAGGALRIAAIRGREIET
jgi:hypothetical protein